MSLVAYLTIIELLDKLNNLLIFKNGEEHLNDPVISVTEVEIIMCIVVLFRCPGYNRFSEYTQSRCSQRLKAT